MATTLSYGVDTDVMGGVAAAGLTLCTLLCLAHCIQIGLRRSQSPSLLTSLERSWSWAAVDESLRRLSLRWAFLGLGAFWCGSSPKRRWRIVRAPAADVLPSIRIVEQQLLTSGRSTSTREQAAARRRAEWELERCMRPSSAKLNTGAVRNAIAKAEAAGASSTVLELARKRLATESDGDSTARSAPDAKGGYLAASTKEEEGEAEFDAPFAIDDVPRTSSAAVQACYDAYHGAYRKLQSGGVDAEERTMAAVKTDAALSTVDKGVGPEPAYCDSTTSCCCT